MKNLIMGLLVSVSLLNVAHAEEKQPEGQFVVKGVIESVKHFKASVEGKKVEMAEVRLFFPVKEGQSFTLKEVDKGFKKGQVIQVIKVGEDKFVIEPVTN